MPNLSRHRNDAVLVAVGQAIRRERLAKGLSQEALGLLAGVDRTFVGQVERAENNIALLTLQKLSTALELSTSDLLRRAGI